MALAPQFLGTRYGSCTARHVLEAYIDWACPFSAKQLFGFREHLVPRIDSDLRDDLAIVIRASPQPWHASSTHLHEAFIAVTTSDPAKTWPFAYALMEHQKEFFDANVQDETPNATKARLAKLAGTVGADEKRILDLIKLTGESLNSGSKATNDLKLQVKLGRQNGIHVTPTVLLDGLVDPSVSSSFGAAEWSKFIDEKVKGK